MIEICKLYILASVFIQGHRMQKIKNICQLSHKLFNWFEWNFGILLRLVGMMNPILIWSHLFNIEGKEPNSLRFVSSNENKNKSVSLYSDISILISFKLGMMTKISKLYILISVWKTLTFIQGHSCMINFGVHFHAKINMNLDAVQDVATTSPFVEAHAK